MESAMLRCLSAVFAVAVVRELGRARARGLPVQPLVAKGTLEEEPLGGGRVPGGGGGIPAVLAAVERGGVNDGRECPFSYFLVCVIQR